jgi:hypothetical protein
MRLGGDVYVDDGGRIESAYANWYSERRDDEPIESFATRSCAESRSYIARYPNPPQGQVLFVLVVAEGMELPRFRGHGLACRLHVL